jgi:hypothetical protein
MENALRRRLDANGPALATLAERMRALVVATIAADAPADALAEATAAVERALARLAPYAAAGDVERYPIPPSVATPNDLMPFDPVMGRLSPVAPPVAMAWDGEKATGRTRFGVAHAGPPGCVHGGVLAAVFDQVLNVPNIMTGVAGPTARLVVHYRKPTPLHADLVFEGWQERTEGRRVHARGRCLHGETVTVEAEAVFVRVPVERIVRLLD